MIKIEKSAREDGVLNEESQSSGIKFALVRNGRRITPRVLCRDFFTDAWFCGVYGCSTEIFGFKYDCNDCPEFPLGIEALELQVCLPKGSDISVERAFRFAGQACHLRKTTAAYERVYRDRFSYLITADKFWASSPQALSLFTLLIRTGCEKYFKDCETLADIERLLNASPFANKEVLLFRDVNAIPGGLEAVITKLLPADLTVEKEQLDAETMRDMHELCGITSAFGNIAPNGYKRDFATQRLPNVLKDLIPRHVAQ